MSSEDEISVGGSLTTDPLQSSESSFSNLSGSGCGSEYFSKYRWNRVPELDNYVEYEFGQIEVCPQTEAFIMKFYSSAKSADDENEREVICQLDDFIDIPIEECADVLDNIKPNRILLQKLNIEIQFANAKYQSKIENVMKLYNCRRRKCDPVMVQRVVFFCYDFKMASHFAETVASLAPRLFELNVGIPNKRVLPLIPSEEAAYVSEFLDLFFKEQTWETIRVLRIYNFVKLDNAFQKILQGLVRLKHLTISNIDEIECFESDNVESILLDGCDAAFTYCDIDFSKKCAGMFPSCTLFGFLRCPMEIAINALNQFIGRRINDNRNYIGFYQPEPEFKEFLLEATKNFEVVSNNKEPQGEIEIIGHQGGPRVHVFNPNVVFYSDAN